MYSVLLADDEPMVRKGLKLILEKSNLPIDEICEADDGVEALSLTAEYAPDIIITDIRMPNLNGLEFCNKIYEIYPGSSVIIVSGYDDFKFAQEAIKYGVKDYLLKPVNRTKLIQSVSRIISTSKTSEEPRYVSYREIDYILDKIEKGLWNNDNQLFKQAIEKLTDLFENYPLEYCRIMAKEIINLAMDRVLARDSYTFETDIDECVELTNEGLCCWLEDMLNRLQQELNEKRLCADYKLKWLSTSLR